MMEGRSSARVPLRNVSPSELRFFDLILMSVEHLVQTQVLDLEDAPINRVFLSASANNATLGVRQCR
jgi:hypothetical protein